MDSRQGPKYGTWCVCVCVCSLSVCVQLFLSSWTVACQLHCPWHFSNQEYWGGLLFPSPGDFPSPRNKPTTLLNVMWLPCQDGSVGGMHICMYTDESLSRSPETIPTLFENQLYPIQNKKVLKDRLFFSWSSWSKFWKKDTKRCKTQLPLLKSPEQKQDASHAPSTQQHLRVQPVT